MPYTSQRGNRPDPFLTMVSALSPLCLLLLARRRPLTGEQSELEHPATHLTDQPAAPAWSQSADAADPELPLAPPFHHAATQVDTLPLLGLPILAGAAQTPLAPPPLLLPQAGGQDEALVPEAAGEQAPSPDTPTIAQASPQPPATSAIATLAQRLIAHPVEVSIADRDETLAGRIATVSGELLVLVPPADEEVIYVRLECVTALRTVSENQERDDDDDEDRRRRGERDEEADPVQDWDEADPEGDDEGDDGEDCDEGDSDRSVTARSAPSRIRATVAIPVHEPPTLATNNPTYPDIPPAIVPGTRDTAGSNGGAEPTDTTWPEPPPAVLRPWQPVSSRATVHFGEPEPCIIGPEGYKLVSVYRPGQLS